MSKTACNYLNVDGSEIFYREAGNPELHMLDTEHTALVEDGEVIAKHIERFFEEYVPVESR